MQELIGNLKQKVVLVFSFLFFLCSTSNLFGQRTNFSGTWVINNERTELGNIPSSAVSTEIRVDQKKDSISIIRIGENTWSETYRFDGRPSERMMPENKTRTASVNWIENDRILLEKAETIYDDGQQKSKTTYTWKLSVDGTMLNLVIDFETNVGNFTANTIYNKK